jgi:hypothetical protein
LDELSAGTGIAFHPNPSLGEVTLQCSIPGVKSLRFHDVAGSLVMETAVYQRYDLSGLPMGVYMIVALNADGSPLAHTRLVRQ